MTPMMTPSITTQDSTSPMGGFGRSISDLMDRVSGVTRYEAPTPPSYSVRGTQLSDGDLRTLAGTMFGEISNRDAGKQQMEGSTIANTALNRIAQYRAQGGKFANYGLSDVLASPNQYQAYQGPEYKRFMQGSTTPVDQQKINAINAVIGQMKAGQFPDTTGGRVFYSHDPSGKIWLKDGSLFTNPGTRSVADLTK